MRAVYYQAFEGPVTVENVPDPTPTPDGVVIRVRAMASVGAIGTAGWGTTPTSGCLTFPGMNWPA